MTTKQIKVEIDKLEFDDIANILEYCNSILDAMTEKDLGLEDYESDSEIDMRDYRFGDKL